MSCLNAMSCLSLDSAAYTCFEYLVVQENVYHDPSTRPEKKSMNM